MAVVLCFDDAYGHPRQETVVVSSADPTQRRQRRQDEDNNSSKDDKDDNNAAAAQNYSIVDATEHILYQSAAAAATQHCSSSSSSHQQPQPQQQPLPRRRRLLVREFSVSDSHLQEEDVKSLVEVLLSSSSSSISSSTSTTATTATTSNNRIKKKSSSYNNVASAAATTIIPSINRKKAIISRRSSSAASLLSTGSLTEKKIPAVTEEESVCSSSSICSSSANNNNNNMKMSICALERLTLTNNGLTCTSSTSLARIVTYTSQTLQELDLSNNQIKTPGLDILVQALTSMQQKEDTDGGNGTNSNNSNNNTYCALQKLNLFNNRLGSLAAKPIAHLLRYNCSIIDLRLGKNSLKSHKCVKTIATALMENSVLRHLDLSFNQISNANAKLLAQVLDQSQHSNSSNNPSHDHHDDVSNNNNKCRLTSLDLQHNGITDSGALELAGAMVHGGPNKTLQTLDLSTNNLSLQGARAMAFVYKYSHTLQELILSACNIGDAGLHLLCVGWKEQENGCVLKHLDVSWNLIHNSGAMELAAYILDGPDAILTRLNLASNGIANAGACAIAQALVSRDSTRSLRELNLIGNQIGDVGASALANAIASPHCPELYQVQTLSWLENKRMTETGKMRIHRALLFRWQHYETWLKTDLLPRVMEHSQGGRLNLKLFAKKQVLGDDELLCLCHYIFKYQLQIPYLSLQGPHMTQRGIRALCEQVVCGVPPPLTTTTTTTTADKNRNGNNNGGVRHGSVVDSSSIEQKGPLVERLYMQSVPGFGDVGTSLVVQAIMKPSCALIVLSLVDCNISSHGATQLARAFSSLGKSSPLERVNLKDNNIGDVGAVVLLTAVRFLSMQRQSVVDGQGGVVVVLQEPSSNVVCNIKALNLACNNISDASLCPTIVSNKTTCPLEELDMSDNVITDRGALDLAKTCMDLERLRWLTVSGNRMTPRGVQVLNLYLPLVCSLVADRQQSH